MREKSKKTVGRSKKKTVKKKTTLKSKATKEKSKKRKKEVVIGEVKVRLSKEDRKLVKRMAVNIVVSTFTMVQEVRLKEMNRLRALVIAIIEGIKPGDVPTEKEKKSFEKRYTDALVLAYIEALIEQDELNDEEKTMANAAMKIVTEAKKLENSNRSSMLHSVQLDPVWNLYLKNVRGIGSTLAAQLLARIPGAKYENAAKMRAHMGLHLVCPNCTEKAFIGNYKKTVAVVARENGKCPGCGAQGIGEKKRKGRSMRSDIKLRTLAHKVAEALVKTKSKIYYPIYMQHKKQQIDRMYKPGELEKMYSKGYSSDKCPYKHETTKISKKHAHNRALRKMIQLFLQHYWVVCRLAEKLPVRTPYIIQHSEDHRTIISWRTVLKRNGYAPPKEWTKWEDGHYDTPQLSERENNHIDFIPVIKDEETTKVG